MTRALIGRTAQNETTAEGLHAHLLGRIDTLARTQTALTRGAGAGVDLEDMVWDELLIQGADTGRVHLEGPQVTLGPKAAEVLAMVIHELATNCHQVRGPRHP